MSKLIQAAIPLVSLTVGIFLGRSALFFADPAEKVLTPREKALEYLAKNRPGPNKANADLIAGGRLQTGKDWQPFNGTVEEFLARASAVPGTRDTMYFVYRTLEELDPARLPEYAAALSAVPGSRAWQPEALAEVCRLWTKSDSQAALNWAQSLSGTRRAAAISNVLGAMAEADPSQARSLISTLGTPAERTEAARSVALSMAATDPAAALALLQQNPGNSNSFETGQIFEIWANQDPASAAAALARMPSGDGKWQASQMLFRTWAGLDPQAALAAAGQLSNPQEKGRALSSALGAWAQRDAGAACDYFNSLPASEKSKIEISSLVSSMAAQDPQRASALLAGMNSNQKGGALYSFAQTWGQKDMPATIQWISSLTSTTDRSNAMNGLGYAMRGLGADKLLETSAQFANPADRTRFLGSCLCNGSDVNIATAKELLQHLEPADASRLLNNNNLAYYMSRSDPLGAAELLTKYSTGENRSALSEIGGNYAIQDPERAYAWAISLPPENQKVALWSVLATMAQTDGPGALQKAALMTDENGRRDTIRNIMSQWAQQDPGALEAAVGQMTGDVRSAALSQIIASKSQENPASAGEYLLALQQSSRAEDASAISNGISNLSSNWASFDPKAAAAFASQFSAGKAQDDYIRSVADTWVRDDAMSASMWIKDLPAGKGRDGAVQSLVRNISDSDPESAVVWAEQVQNEGARQDAYQQSLAALLKKNPAAGQQAIQAATISDSMKQNLLKAPH